MRRRFYTLSCLLGLLAMSLLQGEEKEILPVYPGRTIYFEPSVETGLYLPLGDEFLERGGRFQLSLDIVNLPSRVNWGIDLLYGHLNHSEGHSYKRYGVGVHSGYSIYPGRLLRINPYGGASLQWTPQEAENPLVSFILGNRFNLHLRKNNQLILNTSLELPLNNDASPSASLSFGIRSSLPLKIPVPSMELSILSFKPDRFSPDEDGDNDVMTIDLQVKGQRALRHWEFRVYDFSGQLAFSRREEGVAPEQLEWDGVLNDGRSISSASDYSAEIVLTDIMGNQVSARKDFVSDILVIFEKGRYRILIPSIVFPVNSADFSLLDEEDVENNNEIIELLAAKLMKFPEYQIRIEGHGNIDNWDSVQLAQQEQEEVLIPLTEKRALAIKEALVEWGLEDERFSIIGQGGAYPLVPFDDVENRWMNRRVEFILLK